MNPARVVCFGSTSDSVLVLEKLAASPLVTLVAVVTQPPKPVGRKQLLTPTPVEVWAKNHQFSVLSFPANGEKHWLFADERAVIDAVSPFKPDLVISVCFGQKIPFNGINIHPSFLPRWRGADPVPWAIYSGDRQTGVTIVQLSAKFDQGFILAQEKINITDTDMSDPLRTKLFTIGAALLMKILPDIIDNGIKGTRQITAGEPYARRLSRDDGFEPWEAVQKSLTDPVEAARIDRKFRAFMPWPGLWTLYGKKRLKILEIRLKEKLLTVQTVQMEGKKPVSWEQFRTAYGTAESR